MNRRLTGNAFRYSPQVIEQTLQTAIQAWKGKVTKSPLSQLTDALNRMQDYGKTVGQIMDTLNKFQRKRDFVLSFGEVSKIMSADEHEHFHLTKSYVVR